MALNSADDKFLGEKVDYYCSSSEDEGGPENEPAPVPAPQPVNRGKKFVAQTGPKGVIEDWRRYTDLATEKRKKEEEDKKKFLKEMSMTCDPNADKSDDEMDEDDEKFLEWYNKKRMYDLQQKFAAKWAGITFGKVNDLDASSYVEEIENENKFVTIIIHIYDERYPGCTAMNGCFEVLAKEYRTVKFCRIRAHDAKVSKEFIENALPALLVYKNNQIVGNFVHLTDIFGDDFFATDVESFLRSYSFLPDSNSSEQNEDRDSSDED